MLQVRICGWCKNDFTPKRQSQSFCSRSCNALFQRSLPGSPLIAANKIDKNRSHKKCSTCKEVKSVDNFSVKKSNPDGHSYNCKECVFNADKDPNLVKRRKEWKIRNSHRLIIAHRKYLYGLTEEKFNKMFEVQNGCCAICGKHQSDFKRALSVDHCHESGSVRGLLCSKCNTGLGSFKDDPTLLMKAAKYLQPE